MGHSVEQVAGGDGLAAMQVGGDHGVPGKEIFLRHFVEQAAGRVKEAVLGKGGDHCIVGDGVAERHGREDGVGLLDLAAFGQLSDFLVGEEDGAAAAARWRRHTRSKLA